jgi:hypothetical protein
MCRWPAVLVLCACGPGLSPAVHQDWTRVAGDVAEPSPRDPSASSEPSASPVLCPERVGDLPTSTLYDETDRRLLGAHLLVAHKSARRLMLYADGELAACWPIGLGFTPVGPKQVEGDGKTPEGWYRTSDKPWSVFENAIAVHYPNAVDADAALSDGRIRRRTADAIADANRRGRVPPQRTVLGGAILIHGGGSDVDWTLGCIALHDADLGDLRSRLPSGKRTNILVLP